MPRRCPAPSVFALLLDRERVAAVHSPSLCTRIAAQHVSSNGPGDLLQIVKEYPVDASRNRVMFMWEKREGRWHVLSMSEAV